MLRVVHLIVGREVTVTDGWLAAGFGRSIAADRRLVRGERRFGSRATGMAHVGCGRRGESGQRAKVTAPAHPVHARCTACGRRRRITPSASASGFHLLPVDARSGRERRLGATSGRAPADCSPRTGRRAAPRIRAALATGIHTLAVAFGSHKSARLLLDRRIHPVEDVLRHSLALGIPLLVDVVGVLGAGHYSAVDLDPVFTCEHRPLGRADQL